ncbi:glycosyltransferase family 2 protein [Iamia majanohamensis]|uniref:Glycosyltransferase family 2 protein n=1 Tax=Iamia majanohamensis TaxID=467976 RepID=A0AAE9YDL6_9ACTN|nr:glycosyltransferase family 2 protein [Iamia majanohamensis]WCO65876.1 glycosyltransferase family 2 protein [Iamia majanohamensis]
MADTVAVVVPVHDNAGTLPALHEGLTGAMAVLGRPWVVLYVDDASTDASWRWVRDQAATDAHVAGIRLATNVGQTRAVATGIAVAVATTSPGVVATIDADLDYDPGQLPELLDALAGPRAVAAGVRTVRTGSSAAQVAASAAFNLTLRVATGYRLGDVGCGYIAMSAAVAADVGSAGARRLAIRPLLSDLAGTVAQVPVTYRTRSGGGTGWRARVAIATEVLAVGRGPAGALAAVAVAALVRAGPRRRRPGPVVLAALATATSAALTRRHRVLVATAAGPLAEVAEAVGAGQGDGGVGAPG